MAKLKRFFDRVKIRDLYDISNLKAHFDTTGDPDEIVHKALLYYASISACFPNEFVGRSKRFEGRQKDLENQLLPMLHSRDEKPTLEGLMSNAEEFTTAYILPRDDDERLYLELFARGEYRPELLFGECDAARAAIASSEAKWKLANLKKMNQ